MNKPLTDSDSMPFGIHKGAALSDVPDDYLIWCESKQWVAKLHPKLYAYIQENWDSINPENLKE